MIRQSSFHRDMCELLSATCWEVQQLRNSCKCALPSSHSITGGKGFTTVFMEVRKKKKTQ